MLGFFSVKTFSHNQSRGEKKGYDPLTSLALRGFTLMMARLEALRGLNQNLLFWVGLQ
jgi:hypothetical protein